MVDVGGALSSTSQKGSPSHGACEGRTLECHERGKGGGGTLHPCIKWGSIFPSLSPLPFGHTLPHTRSKSTLSYTQCARFTLPPPKESKKASIFQLSSHSLRARIGRRRKTQGALHTLPLSWSGHGDLHHLLHLGHGFPCLPSFHSSLELSFSFP